MAKCEKYFQALRHGLIIIRLNGKPHKSKN